MASSIASREARGQSTPLDSKKNAKYRENIGKKREKIGKKMKNHEEKAKNREGSFTLALLTDRAGYATGWDRNVKFYSN